MIKLQKGKKLFVLATIALSLSTGTVQGINNNKIDAKPTKNKIKKQLKYKPKTIFQKLASPLEYLKEQEDEKFQEFHKQENIKYWQWKTEQLRQEELRKQQEEKQWFTVRISYYTSSMSNCGKTDAITASGKKAEYGMIAAPYSYPFGTTFQLENGEKLVCEDRGGAIKIINNIVWLDVFIPNASEEYLNKLGVKYMKAKIVK